MYAVYVIESVNNSAIKYVGFSANIKQRIEYHNNGSSGHTKKYRPWKLRTCIFFSHKSKATTFEKYLKTPSGKAFLNKRLI